MAKASPHDWRRCGNIYRRHGVRRREDWQQRDDRCRSGGVHRCAGQLHGSGKPGKDHPQTAGLNSNRQQPVEISTQFTSNVILPQKCEKPSDCLVFDCNILITKWLTVRRLSGNCLDGLLMKVIVRWKDLSEVRNSADRNCRSRLNPENRNMGITTLTFGHLSDSKSAQQGQARCP